MRRRTQRAWNLNGFTFVEALAALVFVGVVIPVAMQGVLIASRAGNVAYKKRIAASLADRLLCEQAAIGEWTNLAASGDFEEDFPASEYRWTMRSESWIEDGLIMATATVYYTSQGQEFSVSLSTVAEEEL